MATSNLVAHAERELRLLEVGLTGEELDHQRIVADNILDIVEMFARQGHSGSSAAYTIGSLTNLLRYNPLTALTGEDAEWQKVESDLYQNIRCSSVFKDASGEAYDINGIVWEDADGFTYTNRDSFVPVTFPYYPKTEYRRAE